MTDLSPIDKIVPEINIEVVKQKQSEYTMVGFIYLSPGMTLFSLNMVTHEVKKVEVRKDKTLDLTRKESHLKTEHDKDCTYVIALNRKNAIKKINKIFKLNLNV